MLLALPLFAVLLLFCGSALGSVTASISGTVTDASGAAIVGANVTATNVETGIAQTLHTNQQGCTPPSRRWRWAITHQRAATRIQALPRDWACCWTSIPR